MAGVQNQVYLHLVWGTFDRLPKMYDPAVRDAIYRQIVSVGKESGCKVQSINAVEDHIHVLVQFATTETIGKLVKDMKGSSSHLVNELFPTLDFKWQGGYGVFPVAPLALPKVKVYIVNQETHHRERTLNAALEAGLIPRKTE
jgi:putative transposase